MTSEEANATNVVSSSKVVETAVDHGGGSGLTLTTEEQLEEEAGTLLRSPNDVSPTQLLVQDATIYQADVVEGEAPTTKKPAEEGAGGMPAAAAPPEGAAAAAAASSPAGPAEAAAAETKEDTKGADLVGETTMAPATMADTTVSPAKVDEKKGMAAVTSSPAPTKDPYAIDIPLDKKINKRTQRKLWEEIEKRKPLIPKHVALHIQKYAKPPFETWGCKFRGRSSCSACK